jgi:divalent metal cation (Fe/Co/Zn/Cd) transporter
LARARTTALRLALLILVWDVVEGVVAVTAGIAAGATALIGFGLDSGIEVFAAAVVLWQLTRGGSQRGTARPRLMAGTFLVLAVYVAAEAASALVAGSEAEESLLGIVLNIVALLVMVPVAIAQRRAGHALGNDVVVAQALETWLSNALSVSLLVDLRLNAAFGIAWADLFAALIVAGFALYNAKESLEQAQEVSGRWCSTGSSAGR